MEVPRDASRSPSPAVTYGDEMSARGDASEAQLNAELQARMVKMEEEDDDMMECDDYDTQCSPCEEEEDEMPNLFPEEEICKYKKANNGKGYMRQYIFSYADDENGTLMGGCRNCRRADCVPISEFAPLDCNTNARRRPEFFKAMNDYEAAYAARDLEGARAARAIVEAKRNQKCQVCAEKTRKLTPKEQACKDFYIQTRAAACFANNGCCNPFCVERGMQAQWVLQGDHIYTINDPDLQLRKVYMLSDYVYWAYHGGVEAMQREVDKGIRWPCAFCHMLEKTTDAANKYDYLLDMPNGKSTGMHKDRKQYMRKWFAKTKYPKYRFVDRIKCEERKCCAKCARPVEKGQEHAFDFDHRDETTKMIGKDTLAGVRGGVGGLVGNCNNAAVLERIEPIIVAEIALCDLLCRNCHHRKTWKYPERTNE